MSNDQHRQQLEQRALKTSLWSGVLFVSIELIMAIITSSQAVLLDSVYDALELVMIILSLILVPLFYRPASEKNPYGYMQVESLFVVLKGAAMASVTIGLVINNIQIMLHGGRNVDFFLIAYFELFACLISIIVITVLKKINNKVNSPTVSMEIQEWKIDAIASFGMSIAFFLPMSIKAPWFQSITPFLDQGITVVLCFFVLSTPVRAIVTGLRDLFLLPPEQETVEHIKEVISSILSVYGYEQLYFDIVRTGRKLWISVYITFEEDEISLSRFKIMQGFLIQALKKEEYQDFFLELLPDIPYHKDDLL